jgi:mitotic-spindle organizing protein 1
MEDPKAVEAREAIDVLHEVSLLMNTGLDKEALSICVSLCEQGVNPEALAAVIKELKREARAISSAQ